MSAAANLSKLHNSNITSSASKSKSGLNGQRIFIDSSASKSNSREGEIKTTTMYKDLSICEDKDETESVDVDVSESFEYNRGGPRMFDIGTMATHNPSVPVSVNSSTYTSKTND
jgi:hypothetical protein